MQHAVGGDEERLLAVTPLLVNLVELAKLPRDWCGYNKAVLSEQSDLLG